MEDARRVRRHTRARALRAQRERFYTRERQENAMMAAAAFCPTAAAASGAVRGDAASCSRIGQRNCGMGVGGGGVGVAGVRRGVAAHAGSRKSGATSVRLGSQTSASAGSAGGAGKSGLDAAGAAFSTGTGGGKAQNNRGGNGRSGKGVGGGSVVAAAVAVNQGQGQPAGSIDELDPEKATFASHDEGDR